MLSYSESRDSITCSAFFTSVGKARRNVVPIAADVLRVVVEARAGDFLEQIQNHLAFAEAVQKHRRTTTDCTTEIERKRTQPQKM